jgi:hypothetical protein
MRYFADNTPGFWLLAGVGFAVLVAQVVSLAIALRQRKRVKATRREAKASTEDRPVAICPPSTWPWLVLSATWLLIPGVAAHIASGARAMLVADIATGRMANLPWRTTDQPNVFSCAVAFAVPSATIAAITIGMALAARGHSRRFAALPLAFLVTVVFPFAAGIWSYSRSLARASYSIAKDYPDTLALSLSTGMAHARLLLEFWARLACAGLAIVAILVLVTAARSRAPRVLDCTRAWLRVGLASASLLGVSIAILSLGRPLRAENRTPWPPPAHDIVSPDHMPYFPHIPVLAGPDRLARAPRLEIGTSKDEHSGDVVVRVSESRAIESANLLRENLRIERLNNPLLHPSGPNDILSVFCAPEVQSARLRTLLMVAKDAGYRVFSFACVHNEEIHRPVLGSATRVHLTAVNASLESTFRREVDGDKEVAATVSFSHYSNFGDLARRMAELRLASKQVILDLSP